MEGHEKDPLIDDLEGFQEEAYLLQHIAGELLKEIRLAGQEVPFVTVNMLDEPERQLIVRGISTRDELLLYLREIGQLARISPKQLEIRRLPVEECVGP